MKINNSNDSNFDMEKDLYKIERNLELICKSVDFYNFLNIICFGLNKQIRFKKNDCIKKILDLGVNPHVIRCLCKEIRRKKIIQFFTLGIFLSNKKKKALFKEAVVEILHEKELMNHLINSNDLYKSQRPEKKIEIVYKKEKFIYNNVLSQVNFDINQTCFDIIVPIYNAYEYTVNCTKSVFSNTTSLFNLYLINDCSTDCRIKSYLDELSVQIKSRLSPNLNNLFIIHNDNNLGFIKTVNKGLSISKNHVVILNTDTEVPLGWSERLLNPILNNSDIASVTPLTNSGTICSFPNFLVNNDIPKGLSHFDVDNIVKSLNSSLMTIAPTGVGFCMALNRSVIDEIGLLDEIYGKGYAEENDWCQRAIVNGYKNIIVHNLFVYHKHGASFGEIISKTKQERIDENLKLLAKRYPNYSIDVQKYIERDPSSEFRSTLAFLVYNKQNWRCCSLSQ